MPKYSNRLVTAHLLDSYLPLSQMFIYQYLKNLQVFRPAVIAEGIQNLRLFPLPHNIYCLADVWKRFTWKWLCGRVDERILNRPAYETMLRWVFSKEKPKLLHAHFGSRGVWALSLKKQYNLPLVTTFYGIDMSKLPQQEKWQNAYQRLFAEGDLFLVEGGHMRRKLIELGCPAEKVKLQNIGVDANKVEFIPRRFPKDGIIKLLICARFTEKKGIEYAIRAMDIARMKYKNLELRIIGDGELRAQIEQLISKLSLEKHVILLGFQPHDKFIDELKQAHIFLAPSVTASDGDSEGGAPTVLLEAQASGVPVISTYHADIPEIVLDGKSGFLVSERDSEALAEKIIDLAQHPDSWVEKGRAGREHIERNHNIHLEVKKLEALYTKILWKT